MGLGLWLRRARFTVRVRVGVMVMLRIRTMVEVRVSVFVYFQLAFVPLTICIVSGPHVISDAPRTRVHFPLRIKRRYTLYGGR